MFEITSKKNLLKYLENVIILKVKVKLLSCVQLFATPWTVAYQVPPSMGFSRQEHWSGVPFPFPGDLSNPGIEPRSPALQADSFICAIRNNAYSLYFLLFYVLYM